MRAALLFYLGWFQHQKRLVLQEFYSELIKIILIYIFKIGLPDVDADESEIKSETKKSDELEPGI